VEHVKEIIGEKTPIECGAPMPDYSIEGMGRPGEIVAIVVGTLLMLGIFLGVGKVLETFYYLLGLFKKPQRKTTHLCAALRPLR